jgi:hypothetical protein
MKGLILALALVAPFAMGGADEQPHEEPVKVVIYRRKQSGFPSKRPIYVDGRYVAKLNTGRFISLALPPGTHAFASAKDSSTHLNIAQGAVVYLEVKIVLGFWKGAVRFVQVREAEAKPAVENLKPLDDKWIMAPEFLWSDSNEKP